ncbi:Actin cortical patch SUR7/pH-response regulator PalI [Kalmanozyma brasiliensis GHG001]|uniref:Uncharacterized protein n=1 Tax=Kalmanozyma brasiliensis (strain GHG001) TaxID=1365824 RepID=V5EGL5_KALBG|nr:Actin cortical patch SUR7/pH-response regulator PalI [Kalmanozyma brasiliensis GHG001]EST09686.1 Actin cortical patch SUR7/pH-response regulator PalI [Kalmanozyma brasiliensis GHG001]
MRIPPVLIIFVGFLSIGASFILQLLVALGLPYIKGIYFLYIRFADQQSNTILRTTFGIWSQCFEQGGQTLCTPTGLGYQQTLNGINNAVSLFFVNKLPYALVVQPISAGFTGAAAGAAFLHLCTNTFLWPLAALWASFLTMAALVIELVLFILARNRARSFQSNGQLTPTGSELGPAIWMQVAALPPVFFGFMMLALGWYLKRSRSNDNYYDDYEPARPVYAANDYPEKDYYYQQQSAPARATSRASRRSRYNDDYYEPADDSRVYGNVGRRDSRRSRAGRSGDYDDYDNAPRRSYDNRRSYDDRGTRRSYATDTYNSRTSLAAPAPAPYRGGRSRRYSERGAY